MNFNLHFGELHSDNSINDKNILFENYIHKCYKVKRILISFNCFSKYTCSCLIKYNFLPHWMSFAFYVRIEIKIILPTTFKMLSLNTYFRGYQ